MSSNQWLRLWHDMPNDPKWRTISRVSKQPISLVISTYIHLLISASRNVTRGHADVTIEDLASALDSDEEDISSIIEAMQGRVLDGLHLSGWDKRQVKKEDGFSDESSAKSAAERKRAQRERPSSEVWRKIRTRIFSRDDYTCQYCGVRGVKLECDHVYPVALGGGHDDSNLVTACFKCNRSKRSKTLEQWRVA